MIDLGKLGFVIAEKQWHNASDGNRMYYFLGYIDVTALQAYQRDKAGTTIVVAVFIRRESNTND